MNQLSAKTWIASLALHGLVLLPLVSLAATHPRDVYDDGSGSDAFNVKQGLAIDMVSIGDSIEQARQEEVAPMLASPTPPPVVETKPAEQDLKDVITAKENLLQSLAIFEETKPKEPTKPEEVAVRDQQAQEFREAHSTAGMGQNAGQAAELSAYIGKIHKALIKAKVPSAKSNVGKVTVSFKIDSHGRIVERQVFRSSGVAAHDKAAVEWIERADFPPLPGLLGASYQFNVPLSFERERG